MKTSIKIVESPQMTVNEKIKSHANDPFIKEKMKKAVDILQNLKNPINA